MKTAQTREIEKAIRTYDPASIGGIKINKFRGSSVAFEVPVECGTTQGGLVDAVRISEYFDRLNPIKVCRWYKAGSNEAFRNAKLCKKGLEKPPPLCGEKCVWSSVREEYVPKILIICFEIKVTRSDFKSKNGHNFVGNLNYYVVPNELYPAIVDLVPENIGVLAYYDGKAEPKKSAGGWPIAPYAGIRKKKDSAFQTMTDEAQKWMILSVMKRIRRSGDTAPDETETEPVSDFSEEVDGLAAHTSQTSLFAAKSGEEDT